jgi:hypothetical protein
MRHVTGMGERRGACRVSVGKLGGERLREDNIKLNFKEIVVEGTDWIDLAQERDRWLAVVTTVMHFQVLQNAGSFFPS